MRRIRVLVTMVLACLAVPAAGAGSESPANRLTEIAPAVSACWHPPPGGGEITLKMSFRRDGTLLGAPRITYIKAPGGPDAEAALATSLFQAIEHCPPRFTPALGAAIAGRIFLIRFIAAPGLRPASTSSPGDDTWPRPETV